MIKWSGVVLTALLFLGWFARGWQFGPVLVSPARLMRDPQWVLVLLFGVGTVLAWRADALASRRERLRRCQKCRCNRTGLAADAQCPQCRSVPE